MQRIRILVPLSFSPQSDIALKQAKILAQRSSIMLTCLYVIEKPGFIAGLVMNGELEKKIRKNMIEFTGLSESEADYVVIEDKAHKAIKHCADERDTDLIVMATRGLSGLEHFLLGSTAERVVAIAPCPVLTVERSL
jgi:nucleotide-binding universal stress UspA family protein